MWIVYFLAVFFGVLLVLESQPKWLGVRVEGDDTQKIGMISKPLFLIVWVALGALVLLIGFSTQSNKVEDVTASNNQAITPVKAPIVSIANLSIDEFRDHLNAALRENETPELQVKSFSRHEVGGVRTATHDISKAVSISVFLDDHDRVLNVFLISGHSSHAGEDLGRQLAFIWSITRTLNPLGDAKQILGDVVEMQNEAFSESDQNNNKTTKLINRDGIDYEVMTVDGNSMLAIGKAI